MILIYGFYLFKVFPLYSLQSATSVSRTLTPLTYTAEDTNVWCLQRKSAGGKIVQRIHVKLKNMSDFKYPSKFKARLRFDSFWANKMILVNT